METTHTQTETRSHGFSKDQVYDAVKNLRRRYVLYYLNREGRPIQLGELAEQVAAWENNTSVENVSPDQRKSVYSALYQTHLPKLEEIGIVTYDRESKEVTFTDDAEDVRLYLATDAQTTLPWHKLYVILSVVGAALVAATWFGLVPVFASSKPLLSVFVLGLFAVTAMAHFYDRYRWRQRFRGATPDLALTFEENRRFP